MIDLATLAQHKRLPIEFLAGLGLRDGPQGGVIIPYYSIDGGEVLAEKRRTALKAKDGSFWPSGLPLEAYGLWKLDKARKDGFFILVEGESDCWALWYHELPALGLPGAGAAKALTAEAIECLDDIYINQEPGQGGVTFVKGVRNRLRQLGFAGNVYVIRTPCDCKDPADLHVLHATDPNSFRAWIKTAIESAERVDLVGADQLRHKANGQAAAAPTQSPPIETFTAADLLALQLPPLRYAVDGLIPEGATLLAGRPKVGKSWLIMQIAVAVASGKPALGRIPGQPGEVLYLALEDSQRRLQGRLGYLLAQMQGQCPQGLSFAIQWPQLGQGGLDQLAHWLDKHPDARLVILDTLAKVRDVQRGNVGIYEEDYKAIAGLQQLAIARGVAIVIVTHTRKPRGGGLEEDPLDKVQATSGLTGAADSVLVLERPRHTQEGTLFVTGRDIKEQKLNLRFDSQSMLWSITDQPADPLH